MSTWLDDYAVSMRPQYQQRLDHECSPLYHIATKPGLVAIRKDILQWVAALDASLRSGVQSRLKEPTHFQNTYHELAVGAVLRQLGHAPEYEHCIDGLTPDWFVPEAAGMPAFIAEVYTANQSRDRDARDRQVTHLVARLERVQHPAILYISPDSAVCWPDLDYPGCKAIARSVADWLTTDQPAQGNQRGFNGVTVEVAVADSGRDTVRCVYSLGCALVRSEALREAIEAKVARYKDIAARRHMPLVVALARDVGTGLSPEDLFDELVGRPVTTVAFDQETMAILGMQTHRRPDGLLTTANPALSAVAWLSRGRDGWQFQALLNANAAHPLPPSALGPDSLGPQ